MCVCIYKGAKRSGVPALRRLRQITNSQPACVHRNRNMLEFPIREAKVCALNEIQNQRGKLKWYK